MSIYDDIGRPKIAHECDAEAGGSIPNAVPATLTDWRYVLEVMDDAAFLPGSEQSFAAFRLVNYV